MKIVVDISHPAHVHFFKNFIWIMRDKGHEILITAKDKDITLELLDNYGFDYIKLGSHKKSLIRKMLDIPIMDIKMYNAVKKFKPDIFLGLSSIRAAHVSFFLRKKSFIYDDTEHSSKEIMLYLPFADTVYTPSSFKKELGPKQIRYNGCHEIAYLHPNYFTPDPSILDELKLKKLERIIIMRFVAWEASHDAGHKGISTDIRQRLISELKKYGQVLISSENELPAEFEPYRVNVAPEKMHDLLYYATLYVGEGGTMASEAAILGTKAIFISTLGKYCGVFDELHKNGLLDVIENSEEALEKAINYLEMDKHINKNGFINNNIDVTKFLIETVERYGDSLKIGTSSAG